MIAFHFFNNISYLFNANVKTIQEKPEDVVDPNNLIHSKYTNIENNNQDNTKELIEPDKMEDGALNTHPAATTNNDILTAKLPVPHNITESKPATDSQIETKTLNIPPPPGCNIKTKTNIATIKYPQFSQHYLGFELLEKVCLHYFPHFQTDKIHQKHLPVHQEYLQHFPPCCQEPQ